MYTFTLEFLSEYNRSFERNIVGSKLWPLRPERIFPWGLWKRLSIVPNYLFSILPSKTASPTLPKYQQVYLPTALRYSHVTKFQLMRYTEMVRAISTKKGLCTSSPSLSFQPSGMDTVPAKVTSSINQKKMLYGALDFLEFREILEKDSDSCTWFVEENQTSF